MTRVFQSLANAAVGLLLSSFTTSYADQTLPDADLAGALQLQRAGDHRAAIDVYD